MGIMNTIALRPFGVRLFFLVVMAGTASWAAADAATTVQPFSNLQPALALNEVTPLSGIFPAAGAGNAQGDTLGFIYDFGGNYSPSGSTAVLGQSLSISSNIAEFSVIGKTYGGDGLTSFNLPNLGGRLAIGSGSGAGLTPRVEGGYTGASTVSITPAQLPPPQGNGQPFSNVQPSLPVQTLIASSGVFPSMGGATGTSAFVGQIANFAGSIVPAGWTPADGRQLPILGNTALFSVLGTTYGGDGKTTFALPDLQGRVAIGADSLHPLGDSFGQESTVLTSAQLAGAPVNDDQPSLAITYLIADSGISPGHGGSGGGFSPTYPTIGQIVAFAGDFVPSGYLAANGQLLPIAGNTALFAILGTTYGGDGISTFALPNLDDRTVIGADGVDYTLGEQVGADQVTLNVTTTSAAPEPSTWVLMLTALGLVGLGVRRSARLALHPPRGAP